MIEILTIIVAQTIGELSRSFLNASILQWRAKNLRNWSISYKDAYLISIKSGLVSLIVCDTYLVAIIFFGISNKLLNTFGPLIGLVSWWFVHSNGLLKLAGPSSFLSTKNARAISVSVFVYFIIVIFSLALILLFFYTALTFLIK